MVTLYSYKSVTKLLYILKITKGKYYSRLITSKRWSSIPLEDNCSEVICVKYICQSIIYLKSATFLKYFMIIHTLKLDRLT